MESLRRLLQDDPVVNDVIPGDAPADEDPSAYEQFHELVSNPKTWIMMVGTIIVLVIFFNLAMVCHLKWCRGSCRKKGYQHVKFVDSEDLTESEMEEIELEPIEVEEINAEDF